MNHNALPTNTLTLRLTNAFATIIASVMSIVTETEIFSLGVPGGVFGTSKFIFFLFFYIDLIYDIINNFKKLKKYFKLRVAACLLQN